MQSRSIVADYLVGLLDECLKAHAVFNDCFMLDVIVVFSNAARLSEIRINCVN